MKKFFTTMLLLACILPAFAQIGITTGINIAKYSYTSDRQPIMSFNAGIFYKYALNEKLTWEPELGYTVKGAIVYPPIVVGVSNPVEKYVNHLNFIQFTSPFTASWEVGDGFNFDFGAGPYAAYMIKATNDARNYDGTNVKHDFKIGSNTTDDFKAFDAGIHFKTGFTLSRQLGFHFRYDLGLANLTPAPTYPDLKMNNFSFNLSYAFSKED